MPVCAAIGCQTGSRFNKGGKHTLHPFPKDEFIKKIWVESIDRVDFKLTINSRLCSKHFHPKWYLTGEENIDDHGRLRKKPKLDKQAVPTLHLRPGEPSLDDPLEPIDTKIEPKIDYGDHGYSAGLPERLSPPLTEEFILTDIESINPWSVPDVSEFLKYCCPECDFQTKGLDQFGDHAIENHTKSSVLFDPLSKEILKVEEPSESVIQIEEIPPGTDDQPVIKKPKIEVKSEPIPVNCMVQETMVPSNSQNEEKLPDDFDVDMIDPLMNSLMCSKRDLAKDHKLGVFVTLDVRTPSFKWKPTKKASGLTFKPKKVLRPQIIVTSESVTCDQCPDLTFSHKYEAANHIRDFHYAEIENEQIQVCQSCMEVFPNSVAMKEHQSKFHSVLHLQHHRYQCHEVSQSCDKDFTQLNQFYTHYKSCHPEVENVTPPYKCDSCDKGFIFIEEMLAHQNNEHGAGHEEHKCSHCPLVFRSMKNNLIHQAFHYKDSTGLELLCEFCDFVGSNELDKANHHWLAHNEKRTELMKCEHCDKIFNNEMSIKAHYINEHNEEFKFACSKCPNTATSYHNHKQHHWKHHLKEEKWFQCDKCDKGYKDKRHLKSHYRNVHEKENLNICEHCGFSTYSPDQFRYHIKTHHGGDHHKQCPHCDKRLAGNQKLEIHIDTKHPDSGNKNFTCAFCGKGFIYANSLGHHKYWCKHQPYIQQSKKRHEEYRKRKISSNHNRIWKRRLRNVKCDYCDVAFEKRYEISEHYKINHPGQPILIKGYQKYNCAVCEEVFFLAKNRKKHMEQCHPEMKDQPEVFHCQPCNKTFKTNSSYIGHIKQHHKPVNCDICMKQMSCEYTLRQHRVRVHGIEDGAFFCPICPKSKVVFFSDRLLKMHMKNKHSE